MKIIAALFIVILVTSMVYAQMDDLHGDFANHMNGLHSGNLFRTTFYNDGLFGVVSGNTDDIAGEWPINSGHIYLVDGNTLVGAEVIDANGEVKHIVDTPRSSVIGQTTGQQGPTGDWWTFLPLPGFANKEYGHIAMNKWKDSWPDFWPDKYDDATDPGWAGSWNGYFGKNVKNADEESYYVMDDYQNKEYAFYPDSNDLDRRGLGLRVFVRGFQWANALVQDALFCLFDIENVGTSNHDKVVFGYKVGNNMGDTMTTSDSSGDNGAYDQDQDIAYLYDADNVGAFAPVGFIGGAFLESPGNPYDGIDNDGDGSAGSGSVITEAMFKKSVLNVGDPIVLIDYNTFERTLTEMPNDTIDVHYQDLLFKFWPGKEIEEIANDLVDNNLNGIIDENNGTTLNPGADNEIIVYLYTGLKYVDYLNGNVGADNLLLDERRDDGIDNDNDWDPEFDDLGLDGVAYSGDFGEGDGIPTSGRNTSLPGEPHIDKTDVDESDMIGLTSFLLYSWTDFYLYDDGALWERLQPGALNDVMQAGNIELLYGSGYFPIAAGQTERFSMGIVAGEDRDDLLSNTHWVAKAYNENYNFSKAPNIPNVRVVTGDKKVILIWDTFAEESVDPITGMDFEGYRIYRSTDPGFNDMKAITDGQGSLTFKKPLAQFDLDNEYSGYGLIPIKGVQFYLGDNTGLAHSYIDTTVTNGFSYYYAVTSYDRGEPDAGISPSECTKFISISTSGKIEKGPNVVIARPEAAAAGFLPADSSNSGWLSGSTTQGNVYFEVIDPSAMKNKTYQITFEDTLSIVSAGLYPATLNFSLTDITDVNNPDTLIIKSTAFTLDDEVPVINGFHLSLANGPDLAFDTDNSHWNREGLFPMEVGAYVRGQYKGIARQADYMIVFEELGCDTSVSIQYTATKWYPAQPVNFKVFNTTENKQIKFALRPDDGDDGVFSGYSAGRATKTDAIIFLEPDENDSLIATWSFGLDNTGTDSTTLNPQVGDTAIVKILKPFLSNDVFQFKTTVEKINEELIEQGMEDIKVVPNPYVVANSWEPTNPYSNGRGPRELHFTHLPPKCTIRIFTVRGQLVQTLEHDEPGWDGTEIWDMMTKDQLDIAYGIYVYHVEAENGKQKIGKFAVIK